MSTNREITQQLAERLIQDTDPYLSCDDCFDQADIAIESLLREGTPLTDEFRTHLSGCGVCHEEALALAELIAPDWGLSATQADEVLAHALHPETA